MGLIIRVIALAGLVGFVSTVAALVGAGSAIFVVLRLTGH